MDSLSPAERSTRMSRVKAVNTKPELLVRCLVHSLGYRYRLHRKDLPGRPDLVFAARHKVILVHGCFWHSHDDPDCKLARMPKSRLDFWVPKLEGNRSRDLAVLRRLNESGWSVLTLWECQLRDREALASQIKDFLQ